MEEEGAPDWYTDRDAPDTVKVGAVTVCVVAIEVVLGTDDSVAKTFDADDSVAEESAELTGDKGRETDLSL